MLILVLCPQCFEPFSLKSRENLSPSHNTQHVWLASQIIDTHANTTDNRANNAVLFASLINRNIEGPSCNLLSLDGNVGSVKKLLDFLGNHKFHSGMFGDYETISV